MVLPLMHGSTSPLKNGCPACSHRQPSRTNRHGPAHAVGARVDAKVVQQLERWQRGGPGLVRVLTCRTAVVAGEARAARPLPVFALQRQQSGTPPFRSHALALRGDDLGRGMDEISQHLPADGGVGVEQPLHHGHAAEG